MTEDFLERMHMADQEDDDEDLKQLKQLRQIWLAMPEEEPPSRGLDALMAAARTQAAAMEPKPAWWKRMFALLVRPPALALATIVVVAGGAVLVHRHHDDLDATRSVAVEATGSAVPSAAMPERAPAQVADEGRSAELSKGTAGEFEQRRTPEPQVLPRAADGAGRGAPVPVATPVPVPQVVHPAVTKKPSARPPVVDKDTPPAKEDRAVPAPDTRTIEGNDVEVARPKQIVLSHPPAADPTPAKTPSPPPPPPAHASSGPRGGVTKVGGAQLATDSVDDAKVESVDSLMHRAHEAAARGDCTTAKALATQIGKLDPAYYRDTVRKDATVAKCL